MFKKRYISIILIIILIFSLTGCGEKKVDNTGAIITRLEVESTVNDRTELYVINQHYNYKEILDNNGKVENHEEFYWEAPKKKKLSDDLSALGFYEWDGFKSNNKAMSNALNLKVKATLSNGNTIKASAYGDMPPNYEAVIKTLRLHFD